MTYIDSHERARKERESPAFICAVARKKGYFSVSLRYRDAWLRKRCARLKKLGYLAGGKREGRALVFYPSAQMNDVFA